MNVSVRTLELPPKIPILAKRANFSDTTKNECFYHSLLNELDPYINILIRKILYFSILHKLRWWGYSYGTFAKTLNGSKEDLP